VKAGELHSSKKPEGVLEWAMLRRHCLKGQGGGEMGKAV